MLSAAEGRWAFLSTWTLFVAHTALPLLLFWFLDYTGALRDTSLFAALVVAFGYQQVFAGGVQGILMPGQSSRLWQPFEAWVNKVAARIAVEQRLAGEQYHDRVRRLVARDAARLKTLESVAFFHTKDPTKLGELQQALTALDNLPAPPGADAPEKKTLNQDRKARMLIETLRSSEPQNYGLYLYRNDIIRWSDRAFLLGKARSNLVSGAMILLIATGLVVGVLGFLKSSEWQRSYHQWRLLKLNASEKDRFRSQEFLQARLHSIAGTTNALAQFERIYSPLLKPLRFSAVPLKQADELQHFIFNSRVPEGDAYLVPQLVEALRNENLDVRTRVQQLLTEIQQASYTNTPATNLVAWKPSKEDSPHVLDEKIREWRHWWQQAGGARP